jgi:hypothetical protein
VNAKEGEHKIIETVKEQIFVDFIALKMSSKKLYRVRHSAFSAIIFHFRRTI